MCSNGQLLEIYDVHGSEGTARLTVDGKVLFTTTVYVGKNGLGKTGEGDSKTPIGTMHVLSAFGIKSNPGTSMPLSPHHVPLPAGYSSSASYNAQSIVRGCKIAVLYSFLSLQN